MTEYLRRAAVPVIAIILTGLLITSGCSDELTDATALKGFSRTDVTIHDTTLIATASSTFRQYVPMNGRLTQVGKTGGYDAYGLIEFITSSIPSRDTMVMISAKLKLRAQTWFGDSSGTLSFTVQEVTQAWSQETVRWDSLPAYDQTVRGSFSGPVSADTEQIVVDLDTALVRKWLPGQAASQYGVILLPTASCTVIRGFNIFDYDSVSWYPTLEVIFRNTAGTVQDTFTSASGIDSFVGNIDNPTTASDVIATQSGVAYRSTLQFDLSSIPRGAIVNSAELALAFDSAASRLNRFTNDSLIVAHVRTSADDPKLFEFSGASGNPSTLFHNTYSFDVRHAAQKWVIGPNYGLVLRSGTISEFSGFDLWVFYSQTAADNSLRPRLRVKYSVQNGGPRP